MKRGFIIAIIIGLIIIVAILILLVLTGSTPQKNNSDCTKVTQEQLQKCCLKWASDNKIAIPMCETGKWIIKNNQCNYECGNEPIIGGCGGVSLEYIQECCDKWAQDNNMFKAACTGYWEVTGGECYWKCGE